MGEIHAGWDFNRKIQLGTQEVAFIIECLETPDGANFEAVNMARLD